MLPGLGTWYLPFGDTAPRPVSRTLDCGRGLRNAVASSRDLGAEATYLVFFQWMPAAGYSGRVLFRGRVLRGRGDTWEEATEMEVTVAEDRRMVTRENTRRTTQRTTRRTTRRTTSRTTRRPSNYTEEVTSARPWSWPSLNTSHSAAEAAEGGASDHHHGEGGAADHHHGGAGNHHGAWGHQLEPYKSLEAEQGGWAEARNTGVARLAGGGALAACLVMASRDTLS